MQHEQAIKFWARVNCPKTDNGLPDWNKIDISKCMDWQGSPTFYSFEFQKTFTMSRFIVEHIKNETIPNGQKAYRTCSNQHCANPNHLSIGSDSDLMKQGYQNGTRKNNPTKGENHHWSNLNDIDIPIICKLYIETDITQRELAEKYDVTKPTIAYHLKKNGITGKSIGKVSYRNTIENDKLFLEGKKRCSGCGEIKLIEGNFKKNKGGHMGLRSQCKRCWADYVANRKETDDLFGFTAKVRGRTREAFKFHGYKKDSPTEHLLGCPFETAWGRVTQHNTINLKGNHIDHIVPLSAGQTKQEVELLCHYTNLRLIPARDNIIKGDSRPSIFELPIDLKPEIFAIFMQMV